MKIFDSFSIRIALLTRLQSSSSSWPVRRRVALTRPLEEIRRSASWLADISIENTTTAFLVLIAAYSAMLSAKVVLPMAGRAARISRSVRSDESRVGKAWVSTCRSGGVRVNSKTQQKNNTLRTQKKE